MRFRSTVSILVFWSFCMLKLNAQVGIGTSSPDNSAQLDISSSSKGFLPPRVQLTASNVAGPVSSPAAGLLVYNTATASSGSTAVIPGYYYNSGTGASPNWRRLSVVSTLDDLSDVKYEGTNFSNSLLIGGESTGTLSSASGNTGLGKYVFGLLSSGTSNSAFGFNSQRRTSTASMNTSFGSWALANNTTGAQNVAMGANSLQSNTLGRDNAGFGTVSLEYNTTGEYNTALGSFAMNRNTTGSLNVAVGVSALYFNEIGLRNVSVGGRSLYNNTASYNTAVGYEAGQTNTAGSFNVAIGYDADFASASLTNAIVIGYGASVSASNTIVLGNSTISNVSTSGTITAGAVTYPKTDGTSGQMLVTNGSGTLSWSTPGPPVGAVIMYAGSSAPSGYLVCNGSEVSRTTYAALFSVTGTIYGPGNTTSTFNLPNLTGGSLLYVIKF